MAAIKVGLIGLGNITTYHRAGLAAHADRCELAVVCCRDATHGQQVAAESGCVWTPDYREVFDQVDAVLIATPHHLHFPMARDALNAGVKHLFIEKPVTNTLAECDALIDLAEAQGASVTVGYVLRFVPVVQQLKQLVDSGVLGPPLAGLCRTEHGFEPDEFARFLPWAATVETLGGGVLFSHGCHYVDLLGWLLGEITEASCVANRSLLAGVMEGEDSAFMNLVFASGAVGSYFATWAVRYRELAIDLRIYCRDGQFIFQQFEDASTKLTQIDAAGVHELTPARPADVGPTDGFISEPVFVEQIDRWLQTIETGRAPLTGLREGRRSIAAILAAYESSPAAATIADGTP